LRIKYILSTRFNLDYRRIVSETLGVDPEKWLENRIDLFFEYCYPSVANQSDKDFEWWIFFDFETPHEILERIRKKDTGGLIKLKFSNWIKFREDILSELKRIPDNYDYLMNARLDSDDALSKFNIEGLKRYLLMKVDGLPEAFVLNPLRGLVFDTRTTILFQKWLISNPFQVLVQKHDKIIYSVFTFQHQSVAGHFPIINVSKRPFWLVVVHGGNWLNVKSGRPILFKNPLLDKYFGTIKFPADEITLKRIGIEFLNYHKSILRKVSKRISRFFDKK
jgi:hypothetical protein